MGYPLGEEREKTMENNISPRQYVLNTVANLRRGRPYSPERYRENLQAVYTACKADFNSSEGDRKTFFFAVCHHLRKELKKEGIQ